MGKNVYFIVYFIYNKLYFTNREGKNVKIFGIYIIQQYNRQKTKNKNYQKSAKKFSKYLELGRKQIQ